MAAHIGAAAKARNGEAQAGVKPGMRRRRAKCGSLKAWQAAAEGGGE